MKKIKILLLIPILWLASCETTELDINVDPNDLSPSSADPTLVLNGIQANLVGQVLGLSGSVRSTMRHVNLFGTYAGATPVGLLDGPWANLYGITANRQFLQAQAETLAIQNHIGIAQVLEALAYTNIVDFLGSAVFSEAVNPDIANPSFDEGEDIYAAMFDLLDEAVINLNATDQQSLEDFFYQGELSQWVRLANTLKLRMYIQTKLTNNPEATAAVNAIIASGNYMRSAEDDFIVRFGTNNDNPDVRHPDFANTYDTGAGGIYMSNEFMNILLNDKSARDPRLAHYIYRQTLLDPAQVEPDGSLLPCAGDSNYDFCYLGDGYWGRDHADEEGIPNDGNLRATFGAYPVGGSFDTGENNVSVIDNNNTNLSGAGIFPILTSSFVNFLLAEASLPAPAGLGINGSTEMYLMNGINQSFSQVSSVSGVAFLSTVVSSYTDEVSSRFANAGSDAERLEIIMLEYYIASWGNSIESYNGVRRTGFPVLGGSVADQNTAFPRSLLIPESELNSNDNPLVVPNVRTDQVFWDTNPPGFIE